MARLAQGRARPLGEVVALAQRRQSRRGLGRRRREQRGRLGARPTHGIRGGGAGGFPPCYRLSSHRRASKHGAGQLPTRVRRGPRQPPRKLLLAPTATRRRRAQPRGRRLHDARGIGAAVRIGSSASTAANAVGSVASGLRAGLPGQRKRGSQARLDVAHDGMRRVAVVEEVGGVDGLDQGGEDGCELTLEVEEALGECGGGHLHAPLVAGVDLEVMAVGRVQPQEADALAGVQGAPEVLAQALRLAAPSMREDAAPLQHQLHLRRLRDLHLLPLRLGLLASLTQLEGEAAPAAARGGLRARGR